MIVVICGPPGAGKTTIADGVRRRFEVRGWDVRSFRSDDYSSNTYQQLYARVAVEPVADSGAKTSTSTGTNTNVMTNPAAIHLVDGTFYKREWQRAFRTLENVRFVVVTASLETCLERNRGRDPEDAIDERGVHVVYREFDPPDANLTIDTDDRSVEETIERIVRAIDDWR